MAVASMALVVLLSTALATSLRPAHASTVPAAQPAAAQALKSGKLSPRLSKLSSRARFASPRARARALSVPDTGVGSVPIRSDGLVMVEIRTTDTSPDAMNVLRNLRAHIVHVSSEYSTVTAAVAPNDLSRIAALPTVQYVSEVLAPQVGQTSAAPAGGGGVVSSFACAPIVSEGDTLMNVNTARAATNLDGSGQTIGILSDSFDTDTTAASHAAGDIANGELPGAANPCGHATPVTVQQDYSAGDQTDEGRAMAQLAHDLAPGADLAFATGFRSSLDFAAQITNLRTVNDASVIVDDLSYLDEPFFQDGPIANAANAATAAGVPYFSSAGNFNTFVGGNNVSSYETPLLRGAQCPSGIASVDPAVSCHDFDTAAGVDVGDDITLLPGGEFGLDLQWAEPLGDVNSDFDVLLLNSSNTIVAGSAIDNLLSQKPFEFFGYTNTSANAQTLRIVIVRYSGDFARLKFILVGASGITGVQYNASAGGDIVGPAIFGHNGTSTVAGTAAIPYDNADTSESFSSRGPVTLYFEPAPSTAALGAPQVLSQPKFAATDRVQTSFFAQQVGGVWRFAGTSAAAPQAAAIGALVREKRPGFTPAEIISTLSSTARPVATNGTADAVGGGYLDADAALASVVSLPAAPSPPTTVTGDTEITVNWLDAATDPNFPIAGFTVTPYLEGVAQTPVDVAASPMSLLFSGLTNGASYTFTVTATNANGAGPESEQSAVVFVGIPGPPTGVAAAAGASEASVSWSSPLSAGMTIDGYTVDTLLDGSVLATHSFPPAPTIQTIPDLTNGVEYTFRVAAVNGFGTGAYSEPSSPITAGTPEPPSGTYGDTRSGGSVRVDWAVPSNDNGAAITSYVITPYLNGSSALATTTTSTATATAATISGLTIGASYTFTVAARNSRGVGTPSTPSAAVIAGSPQAPEQPTATPGNSAANVRWLASPNPNGAAVTGYTVRAYAGGARVMAHAYPATPLSQLFTGLTNGTTYQFTVAARNARGLGPESRPGNGPIIGTPAAPTVTATPGNGRATVNWTAAVPNGSAVTAYVVTPYVGEVAQPPLTVAASARTSPVTGLTNGTTYTFKVAAQNARGTGPESVGVSIVVGSPPAPTTPTAKPGNARATVHWIAPTVNSGAAVTGYVVYPYRNGIADPPKTYESTATTQVFTGLANGQPYVFRVAARNARGEGPKSVGSAAIIVGAPAAPTGVGAAPNPGAATVSWTAPANNGAAIATYTVIPFLGTVAQTPRAFNASTVTRTITGLTQGKRYTFKVRAINARGAGPLSAASNAVTVT